MCLASTCFCFHYWSPPFPEVAVCPPRCPVFKGSYLWSRISNADRQPTNTAVLPHQFWFARPYSAIPGIVSVMKSEKLVALAYTPGLFCLAHPSPKLTTPACTQVPFTIWQTRGPPESPWTDDANIQANSVFTTGGYRRYSVTNKEESFCACKYKCVTVHSSTNSWFNSTWQESLPPSWYPAQIMSYRISTCSFGSVRYIAWHELWEMIGTCTSCSGPVPCRGTEDNTKTGRSCLDLLLINLFC